MENGNIGSQGDGHRSLALLGLLDGVVGLGYLIATEQMETALRAKSQEVVVIGWGHTLF